MNILRAILITFCLMTWFPDRVAGQESDSFELGESLRALVGDGLITDVKPVDAAFEKAPLTAGMAGFRVPKSKLTLGGYVQPALIQPGSTATLVVTAVPDAGYHVYPYSDIDEPGVSKATLIVVTGDFAVGRPRTDAAIKHQPPVRAGDPAIPYHPGNATWAMDIFVPSDAAAGRYRIAGVIGYQTCTDTSCDLPRGVEFETEIVVGLDGQAGKVPVQFRQASYAVASAAANQRQASGAWPPTAATERIARDVTTAEVTDGVARSNGTSVELSAIYVFATAFLAGLLLNVMPCVLPVIGLKLMTFVQQAGENRWRVFELNLWYSLGLMTVFIVLAALAVAVGLGWGEQFSSTTFNLVLLCVVFVFGLALLGVWEVPIPGFIGSGAAVDAADREGRLGAYCKGALTTVLATPCTGPLLGPALAWATKQPASTTYATFAMVGLGMASPYLLIGAFPQLIALLPKPGNWMNTFKQFMGFVLMGTIVFIFSFLDEDYIVRGLALLVSLGFACWWIGRTPFSASLGTKSRSWVEAAVVVGLTFAGMFYALPMLSVNELAWEPFTRSTLDEHLAQGNTVFVDFTADW